jgi:hypothetical protein
MSEVQGERLKAEREIGVAQPAGQLTKKQIRALVASLKISPPWWQRRIRSSRPRSTRRWGSL